MCKLLLQVPNFSRPILYSFLRRNKCLSVSIEISLCLPHCVCSFFKVSFLAIHFCSLLVCYISPILTTSINLFLQVFICYRLINIVSLAFPKCFFLAILFLSVTSLVFSQRISFRFCKSSYGIVSSTSCL